MHIVSLGVSKFCFLISLAFCGFLLLIPVLNPPAHQLDLPKPRPQVRPAQTDSSLDAWFLEVSANEQARSSVQKGEMTGNDVDMETTDSRDKTVFGRNRGRVSAPLSLESLESKDIFIAVKTTKKYHKSRLKLLIETWISEAKEQVQIDYSNSGCYFAVIKEDLVISLSILVSQSAWTHHDMTII